MEQVYTGSPHDARTMQRALSKLGIDSIGMTKDAIGDVTVFVEDHDAPRVREYLADVKALHGALTQFARTMGGA